MADKKPADKKPADKKPAGKKQADKKQADKKPADSGKPEKKSSAPRLDPERQKPVTKGYRTGWQRIWGKK